jgi:hypothetical protein
MAPSEVMSKALLPDLYGVSEVDMVPPRICYLRVSNKKPGLKKCPTSSPQIGVGTFVLRTGQPSRRDSR